MFYSPSTKGFYIEDIHGSNIPQDCVEITVEKHLELMNGQSEGKEIVPDENGFPILKERIITQFIPSVINMAQLRIQLLKENKLNNVISYLETSSNEVAKIEWEYSTEIKKDSVLISEITSCLSWTEEDLNNFFINAIKG